MTKAEILYDGMTYSTFKNISLVQNSQGYDIVFTIQNDAGTAVDLTSYSTLQLELRNITDNTEKTISLTKVVDADGTCKWVVVAADTDTQGVFETEITLSDGSSTDLKFKIGLLTILREI